ncbi:MAG TPA: glycosyltransferase 87 family protein, partial [Terriglobales bacterium]|nr:glycosyltransferase 87 family protein [Terriglobales bacterium]
TGGDPYSPHQVLKVQTRLPVTHRKRAWMMWNPPWTLSVVGPFGFLALPAAALSWFLLQFAIVFASSLWLWQLYDGPPQFRWVSILIPGLFLPVDVVLLDCQMTPLTLLGVVAFLYFVGKHRYKSAGAALALLAFKPHLWIPFACVLLLWCLQERKWQLLACTGLGFALLATPVWLRPDLLHHYREIIPTIWDDAAPAWGGLLRVLFGYQRVWLQYLPTIPGLAWTILYWRRHRREWDWKEQLPLLLLVGFLAAPYAWTYDEVVLLPVFIAAATFLLRQKERRLGWWALGIFVLVNVTMFALNLHGSRDEWYIWNVPVWLLAYTLIRYHSAPVALPLESGGGVARV